jgi:hypothetical protein
MHYKIITPAEAGEIRAEATILFEAPLDRAHVVFAQHAGADIILFFPRGGRDVFIVGDEDDGGPSIHGCNMHQSVRDLTKILDGDRESKRTECADHSLDPCEYIIVEG